MHYRTLGSTGVRVSAVAFGAGPVSGLMTGDQEAAQIEVVRRAIEAGINWFDTAATYGQGASELHLGRALGATDSGGSVHVATKVRLGPDELDDPRDATYRSVEQSLTRLGQPRVTLLQLHNSITPRRGDEPTSLTPHDVLKPGGIADTFEELRSQKIIAHLGLTGIGHPGALREVIRSGRFQTVQTPYHLLNPSSGRDLDERFSETNLGNIIRDCADIGMGVFAIRALAGGALAGNPPSAHTLTTPFFPLALYRRDQERAQRVAAALQGRMTLKEAAIRFVLGHPSISAAIIGFGEPGHVDEAIQAADAGPLPPEWLTTIDQAAFGNVVEATGGRPPAQ